MQHALLSWINIIEQFETQKENQNFSQIELAEVELLVAATGEHCKVKAKQRRVIRFMQFMPIQINFMPINMAIKALLNYHCHTVHMIHSNVIHKKWIVDCSK